MVTPERKEVDQQVRMACPEVYNMSRSQGLSWPELNEWIVHKCTKIIQPRTDTQNACADGRRDNEVTFVKFEVRKIS